MVELRAAQAMQCRCHTIACHFVVLTQHQAAQRRQRVEDRRKRRRCHRLPSTQLERVQPLEALQCPKDGERQRASVVVEASTGLAEIEDELQGGDMTEDGQHRRHVPDATWAVEANIAHLQRVLSHCPFLHALMHRKCDRR